MNRELTLAVLVVLLGASGTFLALPHKHGTRKPARVYAVGLGLGGLALILFAMNWTAPGPWLEGFFFHAFGLAAIAGGVLMITARDPIHTALWFALVVLATSGLFLLAGAQFLAAGTVIVYAGAIIVTFLFVIMLAQMEGRTAYDRAARSPFVATWTCFVIFLGVLWCLVGVVGREDSTPSLTRGTELTKDALLPHRERVAAIVDRALPATGSLYSSSGSPKPHVAGLGETLFTDHSLAVELASTLLFVALIGALTIAAPRRPVRPNERPATSDSAPA
ncbi:MAG: NADH-quinone oxidoreductase subunit J [Isosphaeraceae bacterium]